MSLCEASRDVYLAGHQQAALLLVQRFLVSAVKVRLLLSETLHLRRHEVVEVSRANHRWLILERLFSLRKVVLVCVLLHLAQLGLRLPKDSLHLLIQSILLTFLLHF